MKSTSDAINSISLLIYFFPSTGNGMYRHSACATLDIPARHQKRPTLSARCAIR
jgi:hypothetical protein